MAATSSTVIQHSDDVVILKSKAPAPQLIVVVPASPACDVGISDVSKHPPTSAEPALGPISPEPGSSYSFQSSERPMATNHSAASEPQAAFNLSQSTIPQPVELGKQASARRGLMGMLHKMSSRNVVAPLPDSTASSRAAEAGPSPPAAAQARPSSAAKTIPSSPSLVSSTPTAHGVTSPASAASSPPPPAAAAVVAANDGAPAALTTPARAPSHPSVLGTGSRADTEAVVEVKTESKRKDEKGVKHVNHYVMMEVLGRGAYGKVRRCLDEDTQIIRAVKIIRKSILKRKRIGRFGNAFQNVQREIAIWKKLDHPNVVKLFEVIDDEGSDKLYMIGEFIDGGPVMRDEKVGEAVPVDTARKYFAQLVDGLSYLHFQHIVHRDVKPGNLLVDKHTGVLKVTDFGVSQIFEGNDDFRNTSGTAAFLSPEMLTGANFSGRGADVWACGITLYMFIYGTTPFMADDLPTIYDKIKTADIPWPDQTATGKPLDLEALKPAQDLIKRLLERDPAQRITLDQCREHPWLVGAGVNWQATPTQKIEVSDDEVARAISSVVRLRAVVRASIIAKRHLANVRSKLKLKRSQVDLIDAGGAGRVEQAALANGDASRASTLGDANDAALAAVMHDGSDGISPGGTTVFGNLSPEASPSHLAGALVGSVSSSGTGLVAAVPPVRSNTFKQKAEAHFTGLDPTSSATHTTSGTSATTDGHDNAVVDGGTVPGEGLSRSASASIGLRTDASGAAGQQDRYSDHSGAMRTSDLSRITHTTETELSHGASTVNSSMVKDGNNNAAGVPRYKLWSSVSQHHEDGGDARAGSDAA